MKRKQFQFRNAFDSCNQIGMHSAAILIIPYADWKRWSRQAEAENITFWAVTKTVAEVAVSSCPRLLVKV